MSAECNQIIKIVLIGDSFVGKSSLSNIFDLKPMPFPFAIRTVDFITKTITFDNRTVKLQIWEILAQEKLFRLFNSNPLIDELME